KNKDEEMRAVIDHSMDCIVIVDAHGLVKTVNPSMERMLGYAPRDVIGRDIATIIPACRGGDLATCGEDLALRLRAMREEIEAWHKNGDAVVVEVSVSEYTVRGEQL